MKKIKLPYIAAILTITATPFAFLFWKGTCEWTWNILYALVPVVLMGIGIIGADKKEVKIGRAHV